MHNNHKAFTLAEILITLSILGVVAAITIPATYNNYQQSIFITKYRKTYADMDRAFENYLLCKDRNICGGFEKMLKTTYYNGNSFTHLGGNSDSAMVDMLSVTLKAKKREGKWGTYDIDDPTKFVSAAERKKGEAQGKRYTEGTIPYNGGKHIKTLDGTRNIDPWRQGQLKLQNGVDINVGCGHAHWVDKQFRTNFVGEFLCQFNIDVNGERHGPNVLGKDVFYVLGLNDGMHTWPLPDSYTNFYIQAAGSNAEAHSARNTTCNKRNSSGYGCSGWFLTHRNYQR